MRAAEIEQVMGRATALQRRGETDAAAALYRQILKQHRDLAPAHYNLALLLKDQGKTQAAEKSFKAAVTADKGYRLGWRGYARFLSRREKHREAIRAGLKMAALDDYSDSVLQEVADLVAGAGTADLGAPGDEAMLRCLGRADGAGDRRGLRQSHSTRRGYGGDCLGCAPCDPEWRGDGGTGGHRPSRAAAFPL